MKFEIIIAELSPEDGRACLYYVARYVKMANKFFEYEKDVFEDDGHNVPTAKIRELTYRVVKEIEAELGLQAEEFNDDTVIQLLDRITDLETNLSSDLSDSELERGATLAAEMLPPSRSETSE